MTTMSEIGKGAMPDKRRPGTLLFVHGTGVRGEKYQATVETITAKAAEYGLPNVVGVPWGDFDGGPVTLSRSTPNYDATGGGDAVPTEAQQQAARWAVLHTDPWFELELAAITAPPLTNEEEPDSLADAADDLVQSLKTFSRSARLTADLQALDLTETFDSALGELVRNPYFLDAVYAPGSDVFAIRRIVARAVVARAYVSAGHPMWGDAEAQARDDLVVSFASELGADLAIGDALTAASLKLCWPFAQRQWRRHRGSVSDGSTAFGADVLRFLAHGDGPRDFLAGRIRAVEAPVVLLAHSLGGVLAADLLCRTRFENVSALITVGSQAAALHELGAFPALRRGDQLPPGFPPWLNVYDENDMLSYLAEPIFGRVTDLPVSSGRQFAASHSAYWSLEAFWRGVVEFLMR